jgi:chorismate mutase/prephenate dehydratase
MQNEDQRKPEAPADPGTAGIGRRRGELDRVDRELLATLAERQQLIEETARWKAAEADFLRDPAREQEMLGRLREAARELGLDGFYVTALFRRILDHSVRFQTDHLNGHHAGAAAETLVVAYQGTDGAYSHLAAQHHFSGRGRAVDYRGCDTFAAAVEAVEDGTAASALLPIENTTAGSINEVYDLLAQRDLWLVGEEVLKVDHCLAALSPVPLAEVRRVLSHPQALAQCSDFLRALAHVTVEAYADTAMAARRVRDEQDPSLAAVASEEAARLYGLAILRRGIANQESNYTRFVAVARQPVRPDPRVPAKTSLAFVTVHEHGALARCLEVLARHGLNLTKGPISASGQGHSPVDSWGDEGTNDITPEIQEQVSVEIQQHWNYVNKVRATLEEMPSTMGDFVVGESCSAARIGCN